MKHNQSEKTSRKILDATLKLFVKRGFHGTSISDISKATNLTKGAIYFHFKNKDALLKSVLEEFEKAYLDKMFEEVESQRGRAIDKMRHLLRFSLNFVPKNEDLCMSLLNLSTELCSSHKKYEKDIKRIYKKYAKFLADLLEKGQKDNSFRKDVNPNILALYLIGSNDGNLLQWTLNKDEINGADFSSNYVKFFLNSICRKKNAVKVER